MSEEAYEDDEGVEYRCPYCGYTDAMERTVRKHITRSGDHKHEDRHGNSPDTHVEVLDPSGEIIEEEPGSLKNVSDENEVTSDLFPDDVDGVELTILKKALFNPADSLIGLTEKVAEEVDDETDVAYNTVREVVKNHMGVEGGEIPQEELEDEFSGLTEKQQRVLLTLARRYRSGTDASYSSVATDAGVEESYPATMEEKFGSLLDALVEADTLPTTTTAMSSTEPDLTEKQEEIIDTLVENPDAKQKELEKEVDADTSYIGRVASDYQSLIEERRREKGTTDVSGTDEMVETWRDLTENQRSVVKELAKEADPEDPDRLKKDIADAADVHATYISSVLSEYLDVIEALKSGSLTVDGFSPEATDADEAAEADTEATEAVETEAEGDWPTAEEEAVVEGESEASVEAEVETDVAEAEESEPSETTVVQAEDGAVESSEEEEDDTTLIETPDALRGEAGPVLSDLRRMRKTFSTIQRISESEGEDGNSREAVASEVVDQLDSIIEEHADETDSSDAPAITAN